MTGTRRKARRRILWGVAFVVLFHIGLNVALDTVKPEWRDPEYGHRLKELRPIAQKSPQRQFVSVGGFRFEWSEARSPRATNEPVVVALGSSRSQMGLNPAEVKLETPVVVYNFSQAGCGPLHELLNLHRLLDAGIQPDFLLVEILPPVLGGESKAEQLLIPERLSAADYRNAKPYCDDAGDLHDRWMKSRISPWYRYRLNLVSHVAGSLLPWQNRQDFMWKQMQPGGWLPYFFPQVTEEKRTDGISKAHAQYSPYFADFHLAALPHRAYRDLIALCKDRGIRLAFYAMPESPTFRSWYTPKAREVIAEYYQRLRAEGIPVFDASHWFDDETHFADSHHLMRHAANEFSRRFGTECVGPWLGSKEPAR